MSDIRVTEKGTGTSLLIPEESYDPNQHRLQEDQVATVDVSGEGGEFAVGQKVTEESLAGGLYQEVTTESREDLTRKQIDEQFDTASNTAEQVFRGIGSGLSGGTSEWLLRSDDPFERERQRLKRGQAETAFTAGQIGGELAGTFLPGIGQAGKLKYLGKAASFTPAGIASRVAGRVAGRAPTVTRAVGAGAIEGAYSAAGNSIAEQALEDKPFSWDTLGSEAFKGALIGGAAGGTINLAGRATEKIGDLVERPLLRGPGTKSIPTSPDDLAEQIAKAADNIAGDISPEASKMSWRKLYSEAETAPSQIAASAGDVVVGVQKGGQLLNQSRREFKDLFADDALVEAAGRGISKEAIDTNLVRVTSALDNFSSAQAQARKWSKSFTKSAGGEQALAKGQLPALTQENADEAIRVLGNLDEAKLLLDDALVSAKKDINPALIPQPGLVPEAIPPTTGLKGFVEKSKNSRLANTATDVAAGAELLGEVTGVRPTSMLSGIPIVGDVASMYLKYRALRNAFGRSGLIGRTATTEAASKAASAGDRIRNSATSLIRKTAGALTGAKAPLVTAAVATKALSQLDALTDLDDRITASTEGLPQEFGDKIRATALRAAEYLKEKKPVDPVKDSPWDTGTNRINPMELKKFSLRFSAVESPLLTLEQINSGSHPLPMVASEAIQEVYPDIFAEMQNQLIDQLDSLVKTLSPGKRNSLGLIWDIPLTFAQNPQFYTPISTQLSPGQEMQPEARRPAPSSVSKTASLFAEEGDQRG